MPNALMTQMGITHHGRIGLDNVSNFRFGYLILFGAWKLGFGISSTGKGADTPSKNSDF
jgi:hypothetical protein